MKLSPSQKVVIEDIIRHADPKYSARLIDEGIFDKFGISLSDYLLSLTSEQKRELVKHYSGEQINKVLINTDKEFVQSLSSSLSVEDGMILNKMIKSGSFCSEDLLEIAETTSLVTVLKALAKTNDPVIIDYFANQDISDLDIDVLVILSSIDNQVIQSKIALCLTNDINSEILHNVALRCLPSLHEKILENPHVTKGIKYTLKEKETGFTTLLKW